MKTPPRKFYVTRKGFRRLSPCQCSTALASVRAPENGDTKPNRKKSKMNLIKKSILVLAALAAVSSIHAQTGAATKPTGSLGLRYAEASFGTQEFSNVGDNAYAAGLAVNLPVRASLDVTFSYSHSWLNSSFDLDSDALSASATYFTTIGRAKPFFALGLGYEWDRFAGAGIAYRDSYGIWGGAIGVEVPVAFVTLTPRISYVDDFESGADYSVSYGIEASHWFTPKLAGYAGFAYNDPKGGGDSWNYTLGVRLKF